MICLFDEYKFAPVPVAWDFATITTILKMRLGISIDESIHDTFYIMG
ncbi:MULTISPECIES: hypothetical protein [unclassified Bartonella]